MTGAIDRMRCSCGVERVARILDAVLDPLLERRALDSTVHVLDTDPGKLGDSEAGDLQDPRVEESNDERCGRNTFVDATEGDGLFLDHQRGRWSRVGDDLGPDNFQDRGRDALRRVSQSVVGDSHAAFAQLVLEVVVDVFPELGGNTLSGE